MALSPKCCGPRADLDPNHVEPRVLTVYAGLLFRDLLDRCGGDVNTALGAYNGGLKNPNMTYARGVSAVRHARNVMEHAAVLSGPVVGRRFLASGGYGAESPYAPTGLRSTVWQAVPCQAPLRFVISRTAGTGPVLSVRFCPKRGRGQSRTSAPENVAQKFQKRYRSLHVITSMGCLQLTHS